MKSYPYSTRLHWHLRWLLLALLCLGALAFTLQPRHEVQAAPVAVDAALVNAASFDQTRVVAPGSIAALFSQNLMSGAPQVAGTLPLPTTLGGLSVKIDGVVAPLFFVSAGQINLQVPNGVDLGTATVEVFSGGSATPIANGTATIAESAPGVFIFDRSIDNQAAALNSDSTPNSNFERYPGSRPEVTTQFVTIYATGIGRTNPLVPDGQAAPGGPLALADGTTTATIGGASAQILYSGLAPGFVGLWQLNVVIPNTLPTNLATDLSIALKSRTSLPTTLAIAKQSEFGTVTGSVVSALNGSGVGGAQVTLETTGGQSGPTRQALTNAQGEYKYFVVGTGDYKLTAAAGGFISSTYAAHIDGGKSNGLPPIPLTAPLAANQYRVVVTWVNGVDLDAHLTGPDTSGSRFHIWWNGETDLKTPATAQFDRDDQTGAGPETITFSVAAGGTYRFSVQDYSNRDLQSSLGFTNALVTVRIFAGNQQVAIVTPPSGGGTLWKVFELNNGQLNVTNQLGDEPDPSNIKVSF
jgi:uncharacterized protein (TIGR03437 family)